MINVKIMMVNQNDFTNIFGEINLSSLLIFSVDDKLFSLKIFDNMASKIYNSELTQIKKVKCYTNPKQPKFQQIFA